MTGMEHAIEKVANALHGDQCAEDPDPGERCNCGADDFYRQAEIVLDTLREAGLLAPAPLTEEWSAAFTGIAPDGTEHIRLIGTPGGREHAQETCDDCNADDPDVLFFLVRRPVHDWMPVNPAEDDGRT